MRSVPLPALACAAAIAFVVAFARDHEPAPYAIVALALAAFGLLLVRSKRPLGIVALAAVGVLAAPVGWMFGASSAFSAVFTLAILAVGVRSSAREAAAFYATIAGGQALVAVLVLADVLADASILPLIVPGHPMWHHAIAHVAIQGVYMTAFFAGRGFQRRYTQLSAELDAAIQVAARRASLLDEARAEYLRTLALGRQGIFSGHTIGHPSGELRLGELLGRGGAGEVYDARADDGTVFAVKVLRGDRLRDPDAVQSFLADANAAMKIDSPYVVRARRVGGEGAELPFIAMDKLEGTSLRARIDERGAFGKDELRALAADGCSALEAVHGAGLVHGDVSPQNLMLTATGWKLIDVGAGRASGGTPRFVAPEAIADVPTTAADLYSLAACLYAAVTGTDPFAEIAPAQLAHAIATRMPLDPRLHGEISSGVARALQIGLAPAPAGRFASASEMRGALLAAIDGAFVAEERSVTPWSVAPPRAEAETTDVAARRTSSVRARGVTITKSFVVASGPAPRATTTSDATSEPAPVPRRQRPPTAEVASPFPPAPTLRPADEAARFSSMASLAAAASGSLPVTPDVASADTVSTERDARFDATRNAAWQGAFADKARRQRIAVLALCLGGAILLGLIIRERAALWAAWIGIAGIAAAIYASRTTETWPWVIVAALSVGPAYALGLHSGFAAVIALVLFAGRMFRAPWSARRAPSWRVAMSSDWLPLAAIVVGQTLVFGLVTVGAVPDLGNTPVSYAALPSGTGWALHAMVMLAYVGVFATASSIDRNFDQLVRKNEIALRDAAQKAALLSTARAELERALAGELGGLFTGSVIGGYAVDTLIGRGGMGEVYRARRADTVVALKVIRADRIAPANLRRFAREASTLREVDSPYVSRVLEVGSDDRVPFLAMELVEGATLTELLRGREKLDADAARAMIRDISRGLEDVHRAGVLHRDVKPSNLVRTTGDRWKLVDFGIAKFVDAPAETTGSIVVGTPPFMAPEQLAGGAVDARSDIFSLCAVAYRALTGRPAWTTETALSATRPQPANPGAAIADDVALALRIGLATRPADRFATGVELGAAFDAAFDGRLDEALRKRAHAILAREPWASAAPPEPDRG